MEGNVLVNYLIKRAPKCKLNTISQFMNNGSSHLYQQKQVVDFLDFSEKYFCKEFNTNKNIPFNNHLNSNIIDELISR